MESQTAPPALPISLSGRPGSGRDVNTITHSVKLQPSTQSRPGLDPSRSRQATPPLTQAVDWLVLGPDDQVVDEFRSVLRTEADDVLSEPPESKILPLEFLRADIALMQTLLIARPGAGLLSTVEYRGGH